MVSSSHGEASEHQPGHQGGHGPLLDIAHGPASSNHCSEGITQIVSRHALLGLYVSEIVILLNLLQARLPVLLLDKLDHIKTAGSSIHHGSFLRYLLKRIVELYLPNIPRDITMNIP